MFFYSHFFDKNKSFKFNFCCLFFNYNFFLLFISYLFFLLSNGKKRLIFIGDKVKKSLWKNVPTSA